MSPTQDSFQKTSSPSPVQAFKIRHAIPIFVILLFLGLTSLSADAQTICISHGGSHLIERFASDGSTLSPYTTGVGAPLGLAFDRAGNLYSANDITNVIERFTPDGVGSTFAQGYDRPFELAFDSVGNLYTSYPFRDRLGKFSPDGTMLNVFGSPTLSTPVAVACNSSGNVFVADLAYHRIEEFSSAGASLGIFASDFISPYGLAFDAADNLYVTDGSANTIKMVNPDGVVSIFASIDRPSWLAFDGAGNLYVVFDRYSIEKFSPNGTDLGLFATSLIDIDGIAIFPGLQNIPEPAPLTALAIGATIIFATLRRRAEKL